MSISASLPRVRQLTRADLSGILELQQAVAADLPAGFQRPRTASELEAYLDGRRGVAYGIGEGGALTASSLLTLPRADAPAETLDAEIARRGVVFSKGLRERISELDWARATCFLENDMVRREARGRGYQRALVTARLAYAASLNMRWAFAGVHLRNAVSWRNLLAHGMAVVVLRFDPRHPVIGLIRSFDAVAIATDPSDQLSVAAHEPSQHQAALLDGYIGVATAADGGVLYQKVLPSVARVSPAAPRPAERFGVFH
jgi:GNAT superfamily N-acetyltransferase